MFIDEDIEGCMRPDFRKGDSCAVIANVKCPVGYVV
jgi:hypothetical protein